MVIALLVLVAFALACLIAELIERNEPPSRRPQTFQPGSNKITFSDYEVEQLRRTGASPARRPNCDPWGPPVRRRPEVDRRFARRL